MSVRLTVQLTIQPYRNAEFESAARPALVRVQAEDKGCEQYDLFGDVAGGREYVMVESWDTLEAFKAHMKSSASQALAAAIAPYLSGESMVHRYGDAADSPVA